MKHKIAKIVFDVFFSLCISSYLVFCFFQTVEFGNEADGMARIPFIFVMLLCYILGPFLVSELVVYVSLRRLLFHPVRTKMRIVLRAILFLFGTICLLQSAVWIFGKGYLN